jgi:uncharacterized protein with HEPN domain
LLEYDPDFLSDMLLSARDAVEFTSNITWEEFSGDVLRQNAVAYSIQKIGEAATKVSGAFKEDHTEIPWVDIIGMRHRTVHGYRDLKLDVVWNTAREDVPRLIELLEPLIPPSPED